MKNHGDWFRDATAQLGVQFDVPYTAVLRDGSRVDATARVRNFGGDNGMLIFSSGTFDDSTASQLLDHGYGYSVVDVAGSKFDLESSKEMLADWGWRGDPSQAPAWLSEVNKEADE